MCCCEEYLAQVIKVIYVHDQRFRSHVLKPGIASRSVKTGSSMTITKNHKQIPAVHNNVDLALKPPGGDGNALSDKLLTGADRVAGIWGKGFDECVMSDLYGTDFGFGGRGRGLVYTVPWRLRMP